jgi:hypothetical protein
MPRWCLCPVEYGRFALAFKKYFEHISTIGGQNPPRVLTYFRVLLYKLGFKHHDLVVDLCCKPLINVPYICTFGAPDQGQMLDVRESQTTESALRDDWTRNVPHHTLEVVLEVTLEHMGTGLRP